MTQESKTSSPVVNKEAIKKALEALFELDVVPPSFYETYQVSMVVALLMNRDILGEVATNICYQLARFFSIADVNIDGWVDALKDVIVEFQDKFTEKQKQILADAQKQINEMLGKPKKQKTKKE